MAYADSFLLFFDIVVILCITHDFCTWRDVLVLCTLVSRTLYSNIFNHKINIILYFFNTYSTTLTPKICCPLGLANWTGGCRSPLGRNWISSKINKQRCPPAIGPPLVADNLNRCPAGCRRLIVRISLVQNSSKNRSRWATIRCICTARTSISADSVC